MTAVELAKAQLDNVINFAKSDLRVFIEQMVTKDIDYFTDEKTEEINEYLQGSGWVFYGKSQPIDKAKAVFSFVPFGKKREYCFQNGLLTYYVGKVFDIENDLKHFQTEYKHEIEEEERYQETINYWKEYWRQKIFEISQEELIDILVYCSMQED